MPRIGDEEWSELQNFKHKFKRVDVNVIYLHFVHRHVLFLKCKKIINYLDTKYPTVAIMENAFLSDVQKYITDYLKLTL